MGFENFGEFSGVYGLIGGYEDLNDHILIRNDNHFQTLVGHDKELASSATLSRFENSMTKKDINNLFLGMIESFVTHLTHGKIRISGHSLQSAL